ncbi:unnamed protein product [Camellia sinensis]
MFYHHPPQQHNVMPRLFIHWPTLIYVAPTHVVGLVRSSFHGGVYGNTWFSLSLFFIVTPRNNLTNPWLVWFGLFMLIGQLRSFGNYSILSWPQENSATASAIQIMLSSAFCFLLHICSNISNVQKNLLLPVSIYIYIYIYILQRVFFFFFERYIAV